MVVTGVWVTPSGTRCKYVPVGYGPRMYYPYPRFEFIDSCC